MFDEFQIIVTIFIVLSAILYYYLTKYILTKVYGGIENVWIRSGIVMLLLLTLCGIMWIIKTYILEKISGYFYVHRIKI